MSFFRAGFLVVALLATAVVAAPAGAQTASPSCLGLTAAEAEAQGYRVQLGTSGVDTLTGGNTTRDFMMGFGGDDLLTGAGADDVICGGAGNDIITGGDGDDRIFGGNGQDDINLGSGDDFGSGGDNADRIVGNSGDDHIVGNAGADRISGESGNDLLLGNNGRDTIFGGEGNDVIRGHDRNDSLAGGPGNDEIFGNKGSDLISGDDGNDVINGGRGQDRLDGDAGTDTLIGGNGAADACDIADGDFHEDCEGDFAGDAINTDSPPPAGGNSGGGENVQPPTGGPVPASQAPQGVNDFGWPLLTQVGLDALLLCESTNDHAINTGNGFFGGVQWVPATWNAAARLAGFDQYDGVLPHLVPADVQDEVTFVWWEATRPNTQWPTCHARALVAMNVLAP